jgi:hypothetical protein
LLTLEGDLYIIDTEEADLLHELHFNNGLSKSSKFKAKQENTIIDMGFYFKYIKSKSNPAENKIRDYSENTCILCTNNGSIHEYCVENEKIIIEQHFEKSWEKVLILQNYR